MARRSILLSLAVAIAALALPGPAAASVPQARPDFDKRRAEGPVAAPGAARAAARLPARAFAQYDRLRGGVRQVARYDGFLTEPSGRDPAAIALAYVREHRGLFGDVRGLHLRRRWTGADGTTHLLWAQTARGIPAFDNDLRAHIARDGRLISVGGSPRPDLAARAPAPGKTIGTREAMAAARRAAGTRGATPPGGRPRGPRRDTPFLSTSSLPGGRDRARLTWLGDVRGVRLAWRVTVHAPPALYDVLVDARTGEVLRRANLAPGATALVFDFRPGAPRGGTQQPREIGQWLFSTARLEGPNAHVITDVDLEGEPSPRYEVPANPDGNWNFPFTRFAQGDCAGATCSWDSRVRRSWRTNLSQNAAQTFYLVNEFHDHLAADPISFGPRQGAFVGSDRILVLASQGANLDRGLPPAEYTDNAFFMPAPRGQAPTMVLNLFARQPDPPLLDVNAGDDASVVWHEYTHGFSTRLVVDSEGAPALIGQGGAMGEGWSDWYAFDLLEERVLEPDGPTAGEMIIGAGMTADGRGLRTQAMDCPVGADVPGCRGSRRLPQGGYTYGAYGKVLRFGPEVHADGEIWAQTLWDLRSDLIAAHGKAEGLRRARSLVTRGMELSLPYPTFLDMRNAIMQADRVAGGQDRALIWRAFARRGMGYFATTEINPEDASPREDFAMPPPPGGPRASVDGRVVDSLTRTPVRRALVTVNGLLFNPEGSFVDLTDRNGRFRLDLPVGRYPQIQVLRPGFDVAEARDVDARAGPLPVTVELRRDWASTYSGGRIARARGRSSLPECGPRALIDQDLPGWVVAAPNVREDPGPKRAVIRLRRPIDVTAFGIDPGAACPFEPVDPSASLGRYQLETSRDGRRFRRVTRSRFQRAQNYQLNLVRGSRAARRAVRYVRLTLLSPQGPARGRGLPDRERAYRLYMSLTELEVYGRPARR